MKDFHWSENGLVRDVVINVRTEYINCTCTLSPAATLSACGVIYSVL